MKANAANRELNPPGTQPQAAIVIPTRNRAELLSRLLPAFAEQQLPGSYEVIVVDNGSLDKTAEVVRTASNRWSHIRLVQEPRPGAGLARHAGALAAHAPLLIFIDDDMRPEPRVVAEHVSLHAHSGTEVCVLGNVRSAPATHPFERMMAYIYDGPRSTLAQRRPTAEDCWSGHMSLPRELYLRLGGFDEAFADLGGEDLDFGVRMIAARVPLVFAEWAVTHHHFTARFGSALHRCYRNGLAFGRIVKERPGMTIGVRPAGRWPRALEAVCAHIVEFVCRILARAFEPFDRGEGVPNKWLVFVYDLGLRTAISRGMIDSFAKRKKCSMSDA